MKVYFAPYDRPITRMMELWQQAEESIYIVTFLFGHWEAMDLLVSLKDKLKIILIVDHKVSGQSQSLARNLAKKGLEVRKVKVSWGHMHSKYQIIDQRILLAGSLNISSDADRINHEFMIETEDPELVAPFVSNFKKLLRNSEQIVPKKSLFFFWR